MKHHHAPQTEFGFNEPLSLVTETRTDFDRIHEAKRRSEADRAESASRQLTIDRDQAGAQGMEMDNGI